MSETRSLHENLPENESFAEPIDQNDLFCKQVANFAVEAIKNEGELDTKVTNAVLDAMNPVVKKVQADLDMLKCILYVVLIANVIATLAFVALACVMYNLPLTVVVQHTTNITSCNCPPPVTEAFNMDYDCDDVPLESFMKSTMNNFTSNATVENCVNTQEYTKTEQKYIVGFLVMGPYLAGALTAFGSLFGA